MVREIRKMSLIVWFLSLPLFDYVVLTLHLSKEYVIFIVHVDNILFLGVTLPEFI